MPSISDKDPATVVALLLAWPADNRDDNKHSTRSTVSLPALPTEKSGTQLGPHLIICIREIHQDRYANSGSNSRSGMPTTAAARQPMRTDESVTRTASG